ncbi:MAG TPA: 30S ribosome-binding factor RbfA [Planctomycetota bacterium]|nr:30S ribosome-binding factor RbfA [Planctomycetota bacterium]
MAWDRKERLEALIKEKVAIIVLERLNDPRLGFVTITGVQLSKDKRYAKVLYTVLGTDNQRRTTDRALQDAARHVQEQLAPTLRLRLMPELRFAYDESIERESRMLDLLSDIAAQRRAVGPGSDATLADAEAHAAARAAEEGKDEGGEDEDESEAGGEEPSSDDEPEADESPMDETDDDEHGKPGQGDSRDDDR